MRIAENVEMLELPGSMYPVLLWDDNEVILVDSGLPGQLELLRAAVAQAGFTLEQITKLILTHQDLDHIGCAAELARLGAEILAHQQEAPYIQGDKIPVKMAELVQRLPELSEEKRAFYQRLKAAVPKLYVPAVHLLHDRELLPYCGGIKVIHTPGHTPGHIALYLRESDILLCSDAANITDGAWIGANPHHTQDMAQAGASFAKLKALQPGAVVCYHGGYLNVKGG